MPYTINADAISSQPSLDSLQLSQRAWHAGRSAFMAADQQRVLRFSYRTWVYSHSARTGRGVLCQMR
eukprot:2884609-Pleurochrysis_carterae.AAC.1